MSDVAAVIMIHNWQLQNLLEPHEAHGTTGSIIIDVLPKWLLFPKRLEAGRLKRIVDITDKDVFRSNYVRVQYRQLVRMLFLTCLVTNVFYL